MLLSTFSQLNFFQNRISCKKKIDLMKIEFTFLFCICLISLLVFIGNWVFIPIIKIPLKDSLKWLLIIINYYLIFYNCSNLLKIIQCNFVFI